MTDIRNAGGTCVNVNVQMHNSSSHTKIEKSFVDASPLAKPNKFYQRIRSVESCPESTSRIGGPAKALCESSTAKACLNSNGATSRTCKFQVHTSCKEVCVAPRFCAEKKGSV